MRFSEKLKRITALWVVFCFASISVCFSPAYARLISTRDFSQTIQSTGSDRTKIDAFLAGEDVSAQLVRWGMDKDMVSARLDGLTDEEISRMARQIDQLPAGGSAIGSIVGAAVFIFIVLLVTDILGLTDVFPFTRPQR